MLSPLPRGGGPDNWEDVIGRAQRDLLVAGWVAVTAATVVLCVAQQGTEGVRPPVKVAWEWPEGIPESTVTEALVEAGKEVQDKGWAG